MYLAGHTRPTRELKLNTHPDDTSMKFAGAICVCVQNNMKAKQPRALLTPVSSPQRNSSSDAFARSPCTQGRRSVPGTTTGHGNWYSRWCDGNAPHDSVDSSAPWLSVQPGRVAGVCAAAVPSVSPSVPHWHNRLRARPPGCPGEHAAEHH